MKQETCDYLIIGGGIAGLTAAIEASRYGKVIVLTKGKIGESATEKAQGGIAAAIDKIKDSTDFHYEDTINAGAGLCNEKAVRILVDEGVDRVRELINMGAQFDKAETEGGSFFELAIEGAHKRRRILHAGDETGKEIEKTLGRKIVKDNLAQIYAHTIGIDLIIKNNRCLGVIALHKSKPIIINAKATILATGGFCQVYLYNTNPALSTGDGIAMAFRSGADLIDMEFVQFHPTSLVHSKKFEDIVALPRFLISEAVRGEGAKLLNNKNERFMTKYHAQKELAPRDIVSRAITQEINETKSEHVYLSLAGLGSDKIRKRFPIIYKTCLERGLDITKDLIPVSPAAHYAMGGVKTNTNSETNLTGLYAAGEVASVGVHGANRLASNSLLEGLVFGKRAALAAIKYAQTIRNQKIEYNFIPTSNKNLSEKDIVQYYMIIKSCMWENVGIIREEKGLLKAINKLSGLESKIPFHSLIVKEIELKNMLTTAKLITQSALRRKESRGAHFRKDFPKTNNKEWKKSLVF